MRSYPIGTVLVSVLCLAVAGCGSSPDASVPPAEPPPAAGVWLHPGDDCQRAIDAHGEGETFRFAPGVYREQSLVPRRGQSFIGEPGAVLCGARVLDGARLDGGDWVFDGQTQQGQAHGETLPGYERVRHPEDLFIDGAPLRHVADRAQLAPGAWWFDYDADRIWLRDDPRGRMVEASATRLAFWGTADDVVVRGLVVERYANQAQVGAIGGQFRGRRWTVVECEVRLNHGLGVGMDDGWVLRDSDIHHNGQMGVGGNGSDLLVADNEIAFNNALGFMPGWEAGGTKWALTTRLTVRDNWCHDNRGPGLWTDIDNIDTLYERNRVERNANEGIVHEISYRAVIRDNLVVDNGWADPMGRAWLWNAGIGVHASLDVEVHGNELRGNFNGIVAIQQERGAGAHGPHLVANLWVHDNRVHQTGVAVPWYNGASGAVQDVGDTAIFTSRGNRWEGNQYWLGTNHHAFAWMNAWRRLDEWHGYGNDTDVVAPIWNG